MKQILITILAIMAGTLHTYAKAADKVTITVTNPINLARSGEMIETDINTILAKLGNPANIVVTDADGNEVAWQQTYDGKLIFAAAVPAKGKSIYYAKAGTPAKVEAKVFGRQFPERVDDVAWENDRVAFRCYGPALQANGERAWGYDVWNKRTSRLVVEARYASELDPDMQKAINKLRQAGRGDVADDVYNAISYHVDHGNGMDCYKVGPTLGCGTNALLTGGKINYPRCYKTYEILDRGSLRFTVRLNYGTETVGGQNVVEHRIVSLDAGSHMNRATVWYDGLTQDNPLAVGIVVHNENPNAYILQAEAGYMGYEDLGDPTQYKEKYRATQNRDFGKIYVGTVFPQKGLQMQFQSEQGLPGATGHILATTTLKPQTRYTYYFGSGWSRNPETNFQSLTDWEAYLSRFAQQAKAPLKVTVK